LRDLTVAGLEAHEPVDRATDPHHSLTSPSTIVFLGTFVKFAGVTRSLPPAHHERRGDSTPVGDVGIRSS
jgi:hypothetical protein